MQKENKTTYQIHQIHRTYFFRHVLTKTHYALDKGNQNPIREVRFPYAVFCNS